MTGPLRLSRLHVWYCASNRKLNLAFKSLPPPPVVSLTNSSRTLWRVILPSWRRRGRCWTTVMTTSRVAELRPLMDSKLLTGFARRVNLAAAHERICPSPQRSNRPGRKSGTSSPPIVSPRPIAFSTRFLKQFARSSPSPKWAMRDPNSLPGRCASTPFAILSLSMLPRKSPCKFWPSSTAGATRVFLQPSCAKGNELASARGHQQIVQSQLKRIVQEIREANAVQHLLQRSHRNPFLMLVALHLVAHQS